MKLIPITSSNLAKIGYDEKERQLVVELKNGSQYQYDNVPITVYDKFLTSASKGKYFHSNVKGIYAHTKIK